MMRRALVFGAMVCAAVLGMTSDAHAQYKNMSWALSLGGNYWVEGANLNYYRQQEFLSAGQVPGPGPTAAALGFKGGETTPTALPYSHINPIFHFDLAFKISNDFTWWFKTGLNVGLVQLTSDTGTQTIGAGQGGWAILLEAAAGPRVYFLTDNVRPYLEIGVRIPIPGIIPFSSTTNAFMPQIHKSPLGLYGNFGVEFFVAQDVALSISAGYTRQIYINMWGVNSIDAKFGVLFYM